MPHESVTELVSHHCIKALIKTTWLMGIQVILQNMHLLDVGIVVSE